MRSSHLRSPIDYRSNGSKSQILVNSEASLNQILTFFRRYNKPCEFSRDLVFWHIVQRATNCTTSLLILGQKKWAARMSSVCPISPPPCASCNNNRGMELARMHSLLARNTNPSLKMNLFHVLPSWQCISPRQSISSNILLLFLVLNNIRKRFNEFNPIYMSTVQFSLTTNMFQRFIIRMYNKFFGP
jgi:hypothetical protein